MILQKNFFEKTVAFNEIVCLVNSTLPLPQKYRMPIMTISQFDTFLKRINQATGISSQTELAKALNINRSAISQARKKDTIPDRWILLLFRIFGLNPEWIESGSGHTFAKTSCPDDSNFEKIPKVKARLCAGGGSFEVGSEIEDYYAFQKAWLSTKGTVSKMVLMDTFGNSMEPEIKDGDTVLIDEAQKDVLAGAIYAVGIDDTIMVKRVEKHPHKLVLLSDNRDYSPIYLSGNEIDSVRIIGKVIWICRQLR
jgi:phage repressor protein C with HTH and peptisase S24 domain